MKKIFPELNTWNKLGFKNKVAHLSNQYELETLI